MMSLASASRLVLSSKFWRADVLVNAHLRYCTSILPLLTHNLRNDRGFHVSIHAPSGHNKWSKIKRSKGMADFERSKVISKLTAIIASAVRLGGGPNPDTNFQLASAIERARDAEIPKSTIEGAIKNASNPHSGQTLEEVMYEGRGPSGYVVLIEALTANRNRTRPEIRMIFEKYKAVLGEPGSAAFLFDHKGVVTVSRKEVTSDPLDLAIEVGAEDVSCEEQDEEGNEMCRFICDPNSLKSVSDALREKKLNVSSTVLEYIPKSYAVLDEEKYNKACALLDALSEHADVIHVYNNVTCN
eukprot:Em0028g43a